MEDIQPYLYEDRSRQLWNSTGKGMAFDDRFFGIPGVESLGRNHAQKIWTIWNQSEDQSYDDRLQWQMTKSLISAHAPKGARRMNATDKTRERGEKERRDEVLDMFYYRKMGVIDEDFVLYDAQGRPMTLRGPRTPTELADDFLRWVRGEEDVHDTVVREVKERILRNMEAAEEEKRLAMEAHRRSAHEQELSEEDYDLVGYAPSQVNELSAAQGRGGTRRIYDQSSHSKSRTWVQDANPPLPDDQIKMLYQPPEEEQKARPDVNRMIRSRLPKVN